MISVFINSLTSGGAEKVVLTLIDRFRYSGRALELVLIEKEQFYEIPENVQANFLTNYESLEKGFLKIPYLFVCAYRLKKTIRQPGQLVQSHLLRASFINVIAKLLWAKHHAQIVVHSRISFEHRPAYYRVPARWIYKQIFKRADSIVSICEVMKRDLDDYLDLEKHPLHRTIYNPHNLEEIRKKSEEQVTAFSFSKEKKYIISVGRIVKGKRSKDLITAFSRIENSKTDTELILLGDGDLRPSLAQYVHDLALDHCVHFLGFQQNPFAYIAKADLLVLSSEWEGLPNILIEAMACGTTVLSADCISGPREIIHPESDLGLQLSDQLEYGRYGVLYPVGSIGLLGEALAHLLIDDQLRASYVKKGLERAKDFDQSKIAKQYLALFEEGKK